MGNGSGRWGTNGAARAGLRLSGVALLVAWTAPLGAIGSPAAAQVPSATTPDVATTTTTTVTSSTVGPPDPSSASVPTAVPGPGAAPTDPLPAPSPSLPPGVTDAVDEAASEVTAAGQLPFDPGSRTLLLDELAASRRRLVAAERRLQIELRGAQLTSADLGELQAATAMVDEAEAGRARSASTARESLRRAVVGAYLLDGDEVGLVGMLDAVEDLNRARVYLRSLADRRRLAVEEYASARDGLGAVGRELVERSAPLQARLTDQRARTTLLAAEVGHARAAVDAYEAGSHVAVDGFRFPVLGPVSFIDSWGFPRMAGTASAHWHEGVDVIAPEGRELVATEDGVLHGVGEAGLGGRKLWLLGRSGTDYYYAHLSGYATGIAEGVPVVAGQVLGYVGTTGNARGGVPHLHFEVHPAAIGPVNPYPLLWTSVGRPVLPSEAEVLAGPARLLAPDATIAP